jgi:tetratricopeptide (TPR) repeat protein
VRFCPQCGASVVASARFCVECGNHLAAARTAATPSAHGGEMTGPAAVRAADLADEPSLTSGLFLGVIGSILVVGLTVAYIIMRQQPARERLIASAPAVAEPPAASAVGGKGDMPPGHPKITLPKEAVDFIAQTQMKARANVNDLATWNRLGDVTLRAAMFDPAYYSTAADAYSHVLKIEPENLNALRGIGNIDFDQRKYDQAIAAYEHYLAHKPDDPDVRTDLGTMYLSTGVADQAINQYKKVLRTHPDFFEAQFNLAVAYSETNDAAGARTALAKALTVAPDANARGRVNQMLASLNNAITATAAADSAAGNGAPASGQPTDGAAGGTFEGAMEQMLRDLPVAGPKVQSVQWESGTRARVLMDNFPMDQMPPFAQAKFMSDLKAGIDQVKKSHEVSGRVRVDLADAASGRVMQSVTE